MPGGAGGRRRLRRRGRAGRQAGRRRAHGRAWRPSWSATTPPAWRTWPRSTRPASAVGMASIDVRISADASQDDLLAAIAPAQRRSRPSTATSDPAPGARRLRLQRGGGGHRSGQGRRRAAPDQSGPAGPGGAAAPRPCTPLGIQAMLLHYEIPVAGRRVVIVGRGPTLGRPLSMLLSLKEPGANAAVTVVHTGVADWAAATREADIVVGAAGVPSIITPDVIGPGFVVIGGGTHVGRPEGPLGRGRVVRRGGGVDHAPARGGGRDHRRHAAAQHRRRRRAPRPDLVSGHPPAPKDTAVPAVAPMASSTVTGL